MKKEEIFVRIDSEEKRLRAIQILTDASEVIWNGSSIFDIGGFGNLRFLPPHEEWIHVLNAGNLTEISIDQLEQLLAPNYVVQEVHHLTIDELRLQAEKLGFELVERKREVKVGDFGMFWDDENDEDPEMVSYGFLYEKNDTGFKDNFHISTWGNFRHLTDEEKERITQNW